MSLPLMERIEKDIKKICLYLRTEDFFIDIRLPIKNKNILSSTHTQKFLKNKESYSNFFKIISQENNYLAMLKDGSLVTAYYEFESNNILKKASLIYYPNPGFIPQSLDIFKDYLSSNFYEENSADLKRDYLSNSIRVDFNKQDQKEIYHPCSHLHMGLASYRIAIDKFPFFSDFLELILFLNYPSEWKNLFLKEMSLLEYIQKRKNSLINLSCDGNLTPSELKYHFFNF